MTAAPVVPGVGPGSYQLVTNGVVSGGTAGEPSGRRPSGMIFARTPMRGMASDSGTDRAIGRGGPLPGPWGCAWPADGEPWQGRRRQCLRAWRQRRS